MFHPASSSAKHTPSSESECPSDGESDIIGEKRFMYDADLLDYHLKTSLDFWRSIQKARGVGVEDTRRCK